MDWNLEGRYPTKAAAISAVNSATLPSDVRAYINAQLGEIPEAPKDEEGNDLPPPHFFVRASGHSPDGDEAYPWSTANIAVRPVQSREEQGSGPTEAMKKNAVRA